MFERSEKEIVAIRLRRARIAALRQQLAKPSHELHETSVTSPRF